MPEIIPCWQDKTHDTSSWQTGGRFRDKTKKKKRWKDETTRSRQLGKYHEGVAEGTYPATAQAHAQNKRRQLDNHAYRHMAILKD